VVIFHTKQYILSRTKLKRSSRFENWGYENSLEGMDCIQHVFSRVGHRQIHVHKIEINLSPVSVTNSYSDLVTSQITN